MFETYFQNDDLRNIVEYVPDEWRGKAWAQLKAQEAKLS
jgi:hypothetical protein